MIDSCFVDFADHFLSFLPDWKIKNALLTHGTIHGCKNNWSVRLMNRFIHSKRYVNKNTNVQKLSLYFLELEISCWPISRILFWETDIPPYPIHVNGWSMKSANDVNHLIRPSDRCRKLWLQAITRLLFLLKNWWGNALSWTLGMFAWDHSFLTEFEHFLSRRLPPEPQPAMTGLSD